LTRVSTAGRYKTVKSTLNQQQEDIRQ